MPRNRAKLLNELSTADLKNLLAARERIDVLEKEQARLVKELAAVDGELGKLMAGAAGKGRKAAVRKTGRKKVAKKKTAKKKVTRKKATRKKVAKKATKKVTRKAPAKKVGRKAVKKPVRKAGGKKTGTGRSGVKLEDVVAALIKKARGPVAYKELYKAIVDGKLYATKSSNFDNVLRRTLSTSKIIKRVGRGVYGLK